MANVFNAFWETLTAASGAFNSSVVGNLGFLDSVYVDLRPIVARRGQTIRIPFPDFGQFTDQASNDWTTTDLNPNYLDVVLNARPGAAILDRDFEQVQTSSDLLGEFLTPLYQRAQEYANGAIGALMTPANFPTYAPIQGQHPASLTVDDAASGWDLLVGSKVPLGDPSNASLIYHNNIHRNMLVDPNWTQESIVGVNIAQDARTTGARGAGSVAYSFRRKYDQQAITGVTGNLTGTVGTTLNSTAVVGTGTVFTSQATAGSWLTFGTDSTATPYRVAAVTSDTALTLGQPYAGTTAAGKTYVRRTYNSVAMHKYAICLAVRPLELVNDGHITSRLLILNGIPIRIMYSYVHQKGAWMLTADFAMVAVVMRPSFGVIIQS